MELTIQIRGGKPVLVDEEGTISKAVLSEKRWVAGDRVRVDSKDAHLVYRHPQVAMGVVRGFVPTGVILDYPKHPALQTVSPIDVPVRLGYRVVVQLESDGTIKIGGCFSDLPTDDAALLRALYTASCSTPIFSSGARGAPHYTEPHRDHTDLDTFTVDPESSTDLDDAITLDPANRRLYVHIVDIHAGLCSNEGLEARMFAGVSTLYLANEHTEHLLPASDVERMSLNAAVRREVITVSMRLKEDGGIEDYSIYPSTICVKRRMSYADLESQLGSEPYTWLNHLAQEAKDLITLSIPGLELHIDADGLIDSVKSVPTNDAAHRAIAFAMIAANFTVSAHLHRKGVRVPNRFHEGSRTGGGVLQSAVKPITGNSTVDSFLALKKWRGARYDLDARGHFGLGLTDYVHFTSPLRRYADVVVHNLLAGVEYDDWLESAVNYINARSIHVRALHRYYTSIKIARHAPSVVEEAYLTGLCAAGVFWYDPLFLIGGFTHVSRIGERVRWRLVDGELVGDGVRLRVGGCVKITSLAYDSYTDAYTASLSPV
jgi:exoribonuclease R